MNKDDTKLLEIATLISQNESVQLAEKLQQEEYISS